MAQRKPLVFLSQGGNVVVYRTPLPTAHGDVLLSLDKGETFEELISRGLEGTPRSHTLRFTYSWSGGEDTLHRRYGDIRLGKEYFILQPGMGFDEQTAKIRTVPDVRVTGVLAQLPDGRCFYLSDGLYANDASGFRFYIGQLPTLEHAPITKFIYVDASLYVVIESRGIGRLRVPAPYAPDQLLPTWEDLPRVRSRADAPCPELLDENDYKIVEDPGVAVTITPKQL